MEPTKQQIADFSFESFLEYFTVTELPVTVSDGHQSVYSNQNDALPQVAIEAFIREIEPDKHDEFTEYVPCFRLADTDEFSAVVYWRGGLLNHVFVLASFDAAGRLIQHLPIAGLHVIDDKVVQSAATITEDWMVYMTEGIGDVEVDSTYDPADSKLYGMRISEDGSIALV